MPIHSNQAVAEERNRLSVHTQEKPVPSSPHEDCDNFGTSVTKPGRYARFGKTKVGTPAPKHRALSDTRVTLAGFAGCARQTQKVA